MKIASWNINSLRARMGHLLQWLEETQPDLVGLQETKVVDEDFPHLELQGAGYRCLCNGQKSYNGVAILSRLPEEAQDVVLEIPGWPDGQKRVVGATYGGLRLLDLYVPNGQEVGSDKYAYKLDWLDALMSFVREQLERYPRLVVLGDFNIAPDERDVYDPELWGNQVMFSEAERAAFEQLLALGLVDTFRLFTQDKGHFSWWDYRAGMFRRNLGLRIDHILASRPLAERCRSSIIDTAPRRWDKPSDHAPVVAEFDL